MIFAIRSGAKFMSTKPVAALATSWYSAILPSRSVMIATPSNIARAPLASGSNER
jgi:hypothetical protein